MYQSALFLNCCYVCGDRSSFILQLPLNYLFYYYIYHSVPQICPPPLPFVILALVENTSEAYTWDLTISLARRKDAPDASGRLTSFSVGEGEGRFCEVAGVSIVDVGGPGLR